MAKSPDLPTAAKPKPSPAPAPSKKQTTQVLSPTSATAGFTVDAQGNIIDPTTNQPFSPAIQQLLKGGSTSDPATTAAQQWLDSLASGQYDASTLGLGDPGNILTSQQAIAAWQQQLSNANLLPAGYTSGFLDTPTVNATIEIAGFANSNKIGSMTQALGAMSAAYKAAPLAPGSVDPAVLAQEQALRKAQLPLDFADLQRRIKSQPVLDQELNRRIAEQPVLDEQAKLTAADVARKAADEAALARTTATQLQTDAHDKWWVTLGSQAALDWGTRIAQGKATQEDFTQWAQQQAAALYPQIGSYIAAGAQTSTLLDPYLQIAAKELDKAAPTMVGDMRYFSPAFMDQNGVLPDTNTYLQKLRQLPEWRTTTSANNLANDWSAKLAETFGGVAGISTGALTQP